MAWIKDGKANNLSTQGGSSTWEEGRTVFAPMLNTPWSQATSGPNVRFAQAGAVRTSPNEAWRAPSTRSTVPERPVSR